MARAHRIRFIVWISMVIAKAVDGAVSSPPLNAVAKVNGETLFNCSATPSGPLVWTMTKDGISTGEIRITTGCNVNSGLQNHYRTEQPGGPTTCNLIVFDITMDHAGVYHCVDSDSFRALLTVLDSIPTITYNNTPDVMAGENVVITCSLNYSGSVEPASTLRPHLYWTDYTGNNASNVDNPPITNNSVVSQLTVTAGRQDIMPYTCHVYMQLIQTATPSYATNTPSVDSSASSPTIPVLYPVETISIHSTVPTDDKCVSKTETLTCTADANPPAQYMWFDLKNNITTTGANKSISSGGEYQCIASNIIRSQTYNEKKTVAEISCYYPQNLTINGTNCVNNSCTCNGNASYADPISITCMANGTPKPSVKWRSDNSFDGLDGTIGVSLNGNYSCIATNRYGGKDYSAELTVVVYDCLAPPTKLTTTPLSTTGALQLTTTPLSTKSATTVCTSIINSDAAVDVAIAMGVLFGISLVANIILLIILIRRQNLSKRKDNTPEPQIPYHSDSFPPAAYEELRPNDELNLQPTTYEQLTHRPPLYVNHVS